MPEMSLRDAIERVKELAQGVENCKAPECAPQCELDALALRTLVEAVERQAEAARCHICQKQATCIGRYEMAEWWDFACDDCCGHGGEDGTCEPLPPPPGEERG